MLFSEGVFRGVHKITDADSAPELVKESNVGITYELGSHTASISNNGINYKTQYRTVKREIHVKAIGATQFKVGNVTAEQLPKLTLSNGSLAPKHQNDKNDPREVAELQYLNSNKEAVSNGTLSNGLYTPKSLREKPVVSAEGSVISWNKINGIANYVVTVNGTSYFAENQNSMTIVTEPHTEYNITVAGVIGNTADSDNVCDD